MLPPTLSLSLPAGNATLDFVLVHPGHFWMGSAEEDKEVPGAEKPRHPVAITRRFYVAKFLTTQEQWTAVTGEEAPSDADFRGANLPVNRVRWQDLTEDFLPRCNAHITRSAPVTDWQFRLPTEAEWEYAARGGHLAPRATAPDVRPTEPAPTYSTYPGGQQVDRLAWTDRNSFARTHPGGRVRPNALGLYDCGGNLWEWCQDTKRKYEASTSNEWLEDPGHDNQQENAARGLRGGSWIMGPRHARSADRYDGPPANRNRNFGCRLVLAPGSAG